MPKVDFTRAINVDVREGDSPHTILALHGMGESAQTFKEVLKPALERSPHTWIIPNGPYAFERRRTRTIGHAWYLFTGDQDALKESMQQSTLFLNDVLTQTLKKGSQKISVLGFSQGGYLASVYAGLSTHSIESVCCIGGRLKHEFMVDAGASSPRFLQLHGEDDQSVPTELATSAVEATKTLGYTAKMQSFAQTGHEVTQAMLDVFLEWLEK